MKRILIGSLGWLLLWQGARVRAEELQWHPTRSRAETFHSPTGVDPTPLVIVGRPVAISAPAAAPAPAENPVKQVSWVRREEAPPRMIVRAQSPDLPPPPPPPDNGLPGPGGPADERYPCGQPVTPPPGTGPGFLNGVKNIFSGVPLRGGAAGEPAGGRKLFQSDHCFDDFISPVTNPSLFEDPRSLTEVRPILIYQSIPDKNPLYRGGDLEFFGVQARLALTDRWSIVLNKLGYMAIQPGSGSPFKDSYGFTEIHLGPKYTFLRSDTTGTLGAVGLTFQIPAGAGGVLQDTGTLSLVPYLSLAQRFGKTPWGSFHALGTAGYSFAVDNQRSDYFFTNLHLDFNVGDCNHIYPLIELNWIHYTSDGGARDFGFEGGDLANIGALGSGRDDDNFTMAVGARYKFNECIQTGAAVQFPLNGRRDLLDFRLTFDMIFRY